REAGIFHVMAISGAQVAIVALVFYFLLRRLGAGEVVTLWTLMILLPIYASFCGSGPPVVRAALAASVVLGARLLSLDRPHVNALALAALVLLAWQPAWLEDPGFQLSFAAMAAILWLTEPLAKRFHRLGPLATPLAVSIAAQAVVVPITAWHFHGFTWVAPLASLVAVPLSGLIVILGLLIVLFAGIPVVGHLLGLGAHVGVTLLTATAKLASELPAASLAVARPSVLWMAAYYGALATVRHGSSRLRAAGFVVTGFLLAALVLGPLTPSPRAALSLTALDVGHGDALVLSLPEGQRVLIDGGGLRASSLDVGERVVLPYLLDHGGRKLDAVVVTHTDFDHLGGLIAIVDAMKVKEIWEGAPRWERALYRRFRESARRRGIPVRRLRRGEGFVWGGAQWEVLAADGFPELEEVSENERSIVLRITAGESRLLLMGDAGKEIEEELLRRGVPLDADILKVGHHGSRSSTSEAFLEAVRPELAIVSGRSSSGWPLPSTEVLERLSAFGIGYARTDVDGAITVRMLPQGGWEMTTFRERKKRKDAKQQRRRE
ncbi:MAG: DNA internalization-related competence protein ComEC/Rec2, partial [Vicinamibacteria bacterium]